MILTLQEGSSLVGSIRRIFCVFISPEAFHSNWAQPSELCFRAKQGVLKESQTQKSLHPLFTDKSQRGYGASLRSHG